MKGKDLKVGLEVCLPPRTYYSTGYDALGKDGNRRAVVLDARRVWRYCNAPEGGDWAPRPVGDDMKSYRPKRAGYAVAVEQEEYVEENGQFVPTGRTFWRPEVVDARTIMGTWAQHVAAQEVMYRNAAEESARYAQAAKARREWAEGVTGAMAWLGIDWAPSMDHVGTRYEHVSIPMAVLDQLTARVAELAEKLAEMHR